MPRQQIGRCVERRCRYSFHDDGLAIVSIADVVGDLLGPILARIVVDGYIAALGGELLSQQSSEASAI